MGLFRPWEIFSDIYEAIIQHLACGKRWKKSSLPVSASAGDPEKLASHRWTENKAA
jgi:hypothetical protein